MTTPYTPAPFVTVSDTFASLPASAWSVRVDRLLDAPPDLDLADLEAAQRAATALEAPAAVVAGGRLGGDSINDIESIAGRRGPSSAPPATRSRRPWCRWCSSRWRCCSGC